MSNRELVIDFSAAGEVKAMHMDGFDLGFLGQKHVERATEIKFDEASQTWELFVPGGLDGLWLIVENGRGFSGYETARNFEVAWLNVCRHKGIEPTEPWAEWALQAMRKIGKPVTVDEFFALAGTGTLS